MVKVDEMQEVESQIQVQIRSPNRTIFMIVTIKCVTARSNFLLENNCFPIQKRGNFNSLVGTKTTVLVQA